MKKSIALSLISLISLVGCAPSNPFMDYIETPLSENIIEDKYRNYYEIYVGSFYDSDGDKIGDLNGVRYKLDYIKSLGYNGIWLMPIFSSNTYHKYNTSNYYEIDKDYGTMDDLKNLINEAHQKDIKIIIDLVLNHSSRDHEWFKKSENAYASYLLGNELSEEENIWKDVYSFTTEMKEGFSSSSRNDVVFYVESHFDRDMPEFNFDSPKAKELLFNVAKYYLEEVGVDGFRLDAVLYFYKNLTSKNVELLNEFNTFCKQYKEDVYIVGEAWAAKDIIASYYESDIDSFFYFPASGANGSIRTALNLNGANARNYFNLVFNLVNDAKGKIPAPFLDNHDMSRLAATSTYVTKLIYGMLAMLNGSTFTYYGSEIGLTGYVKPDQNVRTHMNWSDIDLTGECINPLGTSKCEYKHPPVDEQLSDPNSIINYYKKANLIRNSLPIVARGIPNKEKSSYDAEKGFISIVKEDSKEDIKILFNLSLDSYVRYKMAIDEEIKAVLLADETIKLGFSEKNSEINIPPYGIVLLS